MDFSRITYKGFDGSHAWQTFFQALRTLLKKSPDYQGDFDANFASNPGDSVKGAKLEGDQLTAFSEQLVKVYNNYVQEQVFATKHKDNPFSRLQPIKGKLFTTAKAVSLVEGTNVVFNPRLAEKFFLSLTHFSSLKNPYLPGRFNGSNVALVDFYFREAGAKAYNVLLPVPYNNTYTIQAEVKLTDSGNYQVFTGGTTYKPLFLPGDYVEIGDAKHTVLSASRDLVRFDNPLPQGTEKVFFRRNWTITPVATKGWSYDNIVTIEVTEGALSRDMVEYLKREKPIQLNVKLIRTTLKLIAVLSKIKAVLVPPVYPVRWKTAVNRNGEFVFGDVVNTTLTYVPEAQSVEGLPPTGDCYYFDIDLETTYDNLTQDSKSILEYVVLNTTPLLLGYPGTSIAEFTPEMDPSLWSCACVGADPAISQSKFEYQINLIKGSNNVSWPAEEPVSSDVELKTTLNLGATNFNKTVFCRLTILVKAYDATKPHSDTILPVSQTDDASLSLSVITPV